MRRRKYAVCLWAIEKVGHGTTRERGRRDDLPRPSLVPRSSLIAALGDVAMQCKLLTTTLLCAYALVFSPT